MNILFTINEFVSCIYVFGYIAIDGLNFAQHLERSMDDIRNYVLKLQMLYICISFNSKALKPCREILGDDLCLNCNTSFFKTSRIYLLPVLFPIYSFDTVFRS